jgi:hypothetical protein
VTRFCINCGADISHKRSDAKWCGAKCKSEAYLAANIEKEKARSAARYAANPEKEKARSTAWRAANPEKAKAITDKWAAANPEKVKAATDAYNLKTSIANKLLKDIVPPVIDETGRIDHHLTYSVRLSVARANNLI